MKRLLAIFRCPHKRLSFPQTPRKGLRVHAASITGCYVVCLDCGRELPYDWEEMRVLDSTRQPQTIKLERSAIHV